MTARQSSPHRVFAGKGMFSLTRSHCDVWEGDWQWLEDLQEVDLPPVDTLLNKCLIQPIQEQVCKALSTAVFAGPGMLDRASYVDAIAVHLSAATSIGQLGLGFAVVV